MDQTNRIGSLRNSYHEYKYIDKDVQELLSVAMIYHRIKGIDENGSNDYSPIRMVNWNENSLTSTISIYSNPANEMVYISSSNKITFGLYNNEGKLIMASSESTQLHNIDISGIASGLYMLKITDKNGMVQNQKVTVRK